MSINRGFTWLDESIEHSDADTARATALAKKWSSLMSQDEDKYFRRLADEDSGYDYDPFEDCECEWCTLANHDCEPCEQCDNPGHECSESCCSLCSTPRTLTECQSRKEARECEDAKRAEHDLEIELIEDKLQAIGARMMRPYEHWNEDEQYMQYMENRYDY